MVQTAPGPRVGAYIAVPGGLARKEAKMVAQAVKLPTEADYRAVDDALTKAHDAVEELQWRLEQLLVGRTDLVPDPEDPNRLIPTGIDPILPDGRGRSLTLGCLPRFGTCLICASASSEAWPRRLQVSRRIWIQPDAKGGLDNDSRGRDLGGDRPANQHARRVNP
jgi:hypothetical protein